MKNTEATFAEPTHEQIANSPVVATVFITVRIEQLKAKLAQTNPTRNIERYALEMAIRELENVL